jgi:hypothetical protein
MRRSDSLPPVPLHFVSFVPRYRRGTLVSLQRRASTRARWPGLCSPGAQTGSFRRRRQGLPGSLTDLGAYMPLVFDPGGAVQPSQNDCTMLPSAVLTTSASSKWSFRGSIAAACTLAVYASQRWSPRHHARLASGWWLVPLPGGIDVRLLAAPPGPIRRVSVTMLLHHAFLPPRAFPGATRPDPVYQWLRRRPSSLRRASRGRRSFRSPAVTGSK